MKQPDPMLSPYLNFDGNCREAMEFYHQILGGDLKMNTIGDYYPDAKEGKERIMHATLENDGLSFMASDGMADEHMVIGDNFQLSIAGTDGERLTEFFNKLSEGGTVTMPLSKQVWGDTFGMFVDKFGVKWMINIAASPVAM